MAREAFAMSAEQMSEAFTFGLGGLKRRKGEREKRRIGEREKRRRFAWRVKPSLCLLNK